MENGIFMKIATSLAFITIGLSGIYLAGSALFEEAESKPKIWVKNVILGLIYITLASLIVGLLTR